MRSYQLSDAGREAIRAARQRHPNSMQGRKHSVESCLKMSRVRTGRDGQYFRGGSTVDRYAEVLCPVGFERERHIFIKGYRVVLDFAHMSGKVNIELDGPHHYGHRLGDVERDRLMKSMGWMIIRIDY